MIVFTEEFCSPENLFPFTLTRQIQDMRIGILTIREKWEQYLSLPSFDKQEDDYKDLARAIYIEQQIGNNIIYLVHGNVLPDKNLIEKVKTLQSGEFLSLPDGEAIVYCISKDQVMAHNKIRVEKRIEWTEEVKDINYPWDIFKLNAWAISEDVQFLKTQQSFSNISETNKTTNAENIFIESGATVEHCFINASEGPVYISKGAVIMEGCMLRGPLSIGEGAVVKMGTKIYGAATIGPYCTVGGEIKNAVMFGYSNKAHDGYLGDSIIGEWCNWGAGTSNSNVKNNAASIEVYTPSGPVNVGLKCGVLMGDFSRTAINTSINTGTVIGVSCNVFGGGLTPKYIPSFSWGSDGMQRYDFNKALEHIKNWKAFKQQSITENETAVLRHIFEHY